MNKSKFLKKSLAMLLALMLVLAMIPLSASAATGEYDSHPAVTVNSKDAARDGDTYSVTIESDTTLVSLAADAPAEAGDDAKVVFIDKNGDEYENSTKEQVNGTIDLDKVATETSENVYTLDVKLLVPNEGNDDGFTPVDYKLVITYVPATYSDNASIRALTDMGDKLAEYEIGANEITIVSKFGQRISLNDLKYTNFVKADDGASISYTPGNDEVTVTAEDGKTVKTYDIEITMRDGLESFEVEGQIGKTKITTNNKNATTDVELTVPYGTDTGALVPTFELGPDVKALADNSKYELASGVSQYNYKSSNQLLLFTEVTGTKDGMLQGTAKNVTVTINIAENTAGELNTIQVEDTTQGMKSNVTEVTGNSVTVEMPKGYDFADASAKTVTLNLTGSANASVEVLAQANADDNVEFNGDGNATINNVDITAKSFKIRVSSEEDGSEYNEYVVTLTAAPKDEVKLTSFIVKGDVNGDGVKETYEMDMETYTLTLPYTAKTLMDNSSDDGFDVYFSVSTGAKLYVRNTDAETDPNSGKSLTWWFNPNATPSAAEKFDAVVTNGNNKATYTLKLDFEDGYTGRDLNSATLVGDNNAANVTDDNTYEAVKGTAQMIGADGKTTTVNTLRVSVPYSFTNGTEVYASDLGLSEGAKAYVLTFGGVGAFPAKLIDLNAKGDQNTATKIKVGTDDAVIDSDDCLKESVFTSGKSSIICVVSEEVYVDNYEIKDWTDLSPLVTAGKVTQYYVYGVKEAAQTGADLKSIDSTLDENVDVTLSGTNIEISVPYSYVKQNKGAWTPFSLNYQKSSMATVESVDKGGAKVELESDLGNTDNEDASLFGVYYADENSDTPKLFVVEEDSTAGTYNHVGTYFEKIVVSSESQTGGQPTNKTTYTVTVKVRDAEKGAELTSVKAAGSTATIASNDDVNLTLPYGTDKYPVQLELEASEMATIYVGSEAAANEYDPETGYDLNPDVKIIVVSEDKSAKTTYTLKTTVAENFFDVADDQWYYDEVLEAAENKWVNGTKPGYFEPNGTMTRGDFALIIARIKNYNPALYTESAFPDVESTDYYSAAIAYCKEMGYLGGENGYFNPKDPITREEMAKIICNAAGVEQVTDPTSPYADDDTIAEWAKGYVYGCQAAEIMMGDENANTFDARSNATRAEAAAVLVRAFA